MLTADTIQVSATVNFNLRQHEIPSLLVRPKTYSACAMLLPARTCLSRCLPTLTNEYHCAQALLPQLLPPPEPPRPVPHPPVARAPPAPLLALQLLPPSQVCALPSDVGQR